MTNAVETSLSFGRKPPSESRLRDKLADAKARRIRAEHAEALSAAQKVQAVADETDKFKTFALAEQAETEAKKGLEFAKSVLQEVFLTLKRAQTRLTQASQQADSASSDKQNAFENLAVAMKVKEDAVEREEAARRNKGDVLREERELHELWVDDTTDVETDSVDDTGGGEGFYDQPMWGEWGEDRVRLKQRNRGGRWRSSVSRNRQIILNEPEKKSTTSY